MADVSTTVPTPDSASPAAAGLRARTVPEKRIFSVLVTVTALALAFALLVNWMWAPTVIGTGTARDNALAVRAYTPENGGVNLGKSPRLMLPDNITSYETIARQATPGKATTSAQAVYETYNVNVMLAAPTGGYAQVEGYASPVEAQGRVEEIMAGFPRERSTVTINGFQKVTRGYSPNRGSLVYAWSNGQWAVMVKSWFKNGHVPANPKAKPLLETMGLPIVQNVEIYQRKGLQGVQANTAIHKIPGNGAPAK